MLEPFRISETQLCNIEAKTRHCIKVFFHTNINVCFQDEATVSHNLQKPGSSHGKDSLKYDSGDIKRKEKRGDNTKSC